MVFSIQFAGLSLSTVVVVALANQPPLHRINWWPTVAAAEDDNDDDQDVQWRKLGDFQLSKNRHHSLAWSPDGGHVITGSHHCLGHVFSTSGPNPEHWKEVQGDKLHAKKINPLQKTEGNTCDSFAVAWSADGMTAFVGSSLRHGQFYNVWGHSKIWKPLGVIMAPSVPDHSLVSAQFAVARKRLVGVAKRDQRFEAYIFEPSRDVGHGYDEAQWKMMGRVIPEEEQHHSQEMDDWPVVWNPNGRFLATANLDKEAKSHGVAIWKRGDSDADIDWVVQTHLKTDSPVTAVAWPSHAGKKTDVFVVGCENGKVYSWDVDEQQPGKHTALLKGVQTKLQQVHSIAMHIFSNQILVGGNNCARILDGATGEDQSAPLCDGHEKPITTVAIAPNGREMLTGSADEHVVIWRAQLNARKAVDHEPGSRIVDGVNWDWYDDGELPDVADRTSDAVLSPDGSKVAIGRKNCKVTVFQLAGMDTTKWKSIGEFRTQDVALTPEDNVGCNQFALAWSPDGTHLFVGGWSHHAKIWHVEKKTIVGTLVSPHKNPLAWAAFSHDGSTLITTNTLWEVKVWTPSQADEVNPGEEREGQQWHVQTEISPKQEEHATGKDSWQASWSPDSTMVVMGGSGGGAVILRKPSPDEDQTHWPDVTRIKQGQGPEGLPSRITAVEWSPDGKKILFGGEDKVATIWVMKEGGKKWEKEATLKGQKGAVRSVSWAPACNTVVTAGDQGQGIIGHALVYHLYNGKQWKKVAEFEGKAPIDSVQFAPSGREILTGTKGKSVRVWFLGTKETQEADTPSLPEEEVEHHGEAKKRIEEDQAEEEDNSSTVLIYLFVPAVLAVGVWGAIKYREGNAARIIQADRARQSTESAGDVELQATAAK